MTHLDGQASIDRVATLTPGLLAALIRDDDTNKADALRLYEDMLGWRMADFNIDPSDPDAGQQIGEHFHDMSFVFSSFAAACAEIIVERAALHGEDPLAMLTRYAAERAQ